MLNEYGVAKVATFQINVAVARIVFQTSVLIYAFVAVQITLFTTFTIFESLIACSLYQASFDAFEVLSRLIWSSLLWSESSIASS